MISELSKRDGAGPVLVDEAEKLLGGVLEDIGSLFPVGVVQFSEFLDSELTIAILIELLDQISSRSSVVNHLLYIL